MGSTGKQPPSGFDSIIRLALWEGTRSYGTQEAMKSKIADAVPTEPRAKTIGRPRSQRSEEAILNAAMDILVDRGYRGFTTYEVVSRAAVSKSTIYRRWPSKELLAVAAVDRLPELTPVDKGSIEEDLLSIVMEFTNLVQTTALGVVWPNMLGERDNNAELKAALDASTERRRAPTKQVLERAVRQGDLPADLDLELAVDMVMGPVLLRLFFETADVSEAAFRTVVQTALKGLGRSSGKQP